jgi:hypothetical protein
MGYVTNLQGAYQTYVKKVTKHNQQPTTYALRSGTYGIGWVEVERAARALRCAALLATREVRQPRAAPAFDETVCHPLKGSDRRSVIGWPSTDSTDRLPCSPLTYCDLLHL